MTIKEVAAASGMSEYTLRYYEKIGLIRHIPRDSSSGHRRYSTDTVAHLEVLACLRAAGLSIEDMRAYLTNLCQGDATATAQIALFEAHADHISKEIERLRVRQRYLEGKVAYWKARERGDMVEARRIGRENHEIAQKLL